MSLRIEVDPIRCDAHGQCAELLPERITLDEWGYPLIDGAPIPASLEGLARRTVRACPTLALRLQAAGALLMEIVVVVKAGSARRSKR